METYVALLRGINVGGHKRIKMADLRACVEGLGFEDVRTYIQSGNVVFGAEETDQARLTERLEEALSRTFDFDARVVVRSHREMKEIVASVPEGFGSEPEGYRYDFIFLKAPLTAEEAMAHISTKEGVDEAVAGKGVLYFSRVTRKASQSRLARIVGTPIYQRMTIRNWNTTTRLLRMMEEE